MVLMLVVTGFRSCRIVRGRRDCAGRVAGGRSHRAAPVGASPALVHGGVNVGDDNHAGAVQLLLDPQMLVAAAIGADVRLTRGADASR